MIDWKPVAEGDAEVGGRATDLVQLAWFLRAAVRDSFDINAVPDPVVERLVAIQAGCEVLAEDIAALGKLMCMAMAKEGRKTNGEPRDLEAEARAKQELEDHLAFQDKVSHRPDPEDL